MKHQPSTRKHTAVRSMLAQRNDAQGTVPAGQRHNDSTQSAAVAAKVEALHITHPSKCETGDVRHRL